MAALLLLAVPLVLSACGGPSQPAPPSPAAASPTAPTPKAAAPPSPGVPTPQAAPTPSPAAGLSGPQARPGAPGADLTRRSDAGRVTIDVTWKGGPPAEGALEFAVVMDTHSVDLDQYDLGKLATLRYDQGRELAPAAWNAPSGGGHHRSGTLMFQPPDKPILGPSTRFIELIIRDVAGVKERVFRWDLAS